MASRRPQEGGGGGPWNSVPPWQTGPGPSDNYLRRPQGGGGGPWNSVPPWQTDPGPGFNNLFLVAGGFYQNVGQYDHNPGQNGMGNQGNFHHSGNFKGSSGRAKKRKQQSMRKDKCKHPNREAFLNKVAKCAKKDAKMKSIEKNAPKTCYDDINTHFLWCCICKVNFTNRMSFQQHLSEEGHSIMIQSTAEKYAVIAAKKRRKIRGKTGQSMSTDFYCPVCDVHADDEKTHCATKSHRKLKKFLHPACLSCRVKEMPSRIEYDKHRLTAEHLRNVQKRVYKMNKSSLKEKI